MLECHEALQLSKLFVRNTTARLILLVLVFFKAHSVLGLAYGIQEDKALDHRILIINSFHSQFVGSVISHNSIMDEISQFTLAEHVHTEYMDLRRFVDDEVYWSMIKESYKYKYEKQYRPDLILTIGDQALSLTLNQMGYLKGVPVVALGIHQEEMHNLPSHQNVTGVIEQPGLIDNLRLIKEVLPETEKVLALADQSNYSSEIAQKLMEANQMDEFKNLDVEIYNDFTFNELFDRLASLTPETVVFILPLSKDKNGKYFSYQEIIPELTRVCAVPVFGMWRHALMGRGILGGAVMDFSDDARLVAQIARRILVDGESVQSIPFQYTNYFNAFDYRVMKKMGIYESQLPEGTKVFFKPPSFYASHRETIIGVILTVILSSAIIIVLVLNIRSRQKAERKNQRLLQTSINQNERFRDFAFIVSHNFRACVANILGLTSLIKKTSKNLEYVELLESNSVRLNKITEYTNQLLSFEHDLNAMEKESYSLTDIINNVLEEYHQTIQLQSIDVVRTTDSNLTIKGLKNYLEVIFTQVFDNAFKYGVTSQNREIEIIAEKKGRQVQVAITDHGDGLDIVKHRDQLFKPGSRFHPKNNEGDGMGLFIAKHQIEAMGGAIKIWSQLNKGTTVKLYFWD